MNVFIAHNKGESPNRIAEVSAWAQTCVPGSVVTTGEQEWAARFAQAGGWAAWTRDVGAGTDLDGRPRYAVIVVPSRVVGRATAQIINAALGAGKIVVFYDAPTGRASSVVRVDETDEESWKAGYTVVTSDL